MEIRERAKKDTQKEQAEAEAPMINPAGIGLLTYGGWVKKKCLRYADDGFAVAEVSGKQLQGWTGFQQWMEYLL